MVVMHGEAANVVGLVNLSVKYFFFFQAGTVTNPEIWLVLSAVRILLSLTTVTVTLARVFFREFFRLRAWKKINKLFTGLGSARIVKNYDLGLENACVLGQHFQDLGHSFSLYGPPSRQITYISLPLLKEAIRAPRLWCFASMNRFRVMYSEATSRIGHRNPLTDWPLYSFEWLCRVTLLSFVENKTAEKKFTVLSPWNYVKSFKCFKPLYYPFGERIFLLSFNWLNSTNIIPG